MSLGVVHRVRFWDGTRSTPSTFSSYLIKTCYFKIKRGEPRLNLVIYIDVDDEMEICNLVNTMIMRKRGDPNSHEEPGELLMPQPRSQSFGHSPPHSTSIHAYIWSCSRTYAKPCILYALTSTSCTWCDIRYSASQICGRRVLGGYRTNASTILVYAYPPQPPAHHKLKFQVVAPPFSRVSSKSKGTSTRSTCGSTKDKNEKIVESIVAEATILHETPTT